MWESKYVAFLYPVNIISINLISNEHQIFIIIIWQFDPVNCSHGEIK